VVAGIFLRFASLVEDLRAVAGFVDIFSACERPGRICAICRPLAAITRPFLFPTVLHKGRLDVFKTILVVPRFPSFRDGGGPRFLACLFFPFALYGPSAIVDAEFRAFVLRHPASDPRPFEDTSAALRRIRVRGSRLRLRTRRPRLLSLRSRVSPCRVVLSPHSTLRSVRSLPGVRSPPSFCQTLFGFAPVWEVPVLFIRLASTRLLFQGEFDSNP